MFYNQIIKGGLTLFIMDMMYYDGEDSILIFSIRPGSRCNTVAIIDYNNTS